MSERPSFDDEAGYDGDRWYKLSACLRRLFSGNESVQSTSEELATISLHPEENLELTWTMIIVAARTFPLHQGNLVHVLTQMSRFPPAIDNNGQPMTKYDARIWQDMPLLGMEFNYEWNGLLVPEQHGLARQKVANDFRNANAFAARLKLTGLAPFEGYDLFGLWTMRAALEDQPSVVDPSDVYVPAAEAWISVVGPDMYHWDREFEYGGNRGDPGRGGALWGGKHGFCKGRWCLWRRRLAEFAESEVLSDEVRRAAASAGMRMEEIEANAGG